MTKNEAKKLVKKFQRASEVIKKTADRLSKMGVMVSLDPLLEEAKKLEADAQKILDAQKKVEDAQKELEGIQL